MKKKRKKRISLLLFGLTVLALFFLQYTISYGEMCPPDSCPEGWYWVPQTCYSGYCEELDVVGYCRGCFIIII
jgi:hypothetical protein